MEKDRFGRPVCLGTGPARPCRTPVHHGYIRCYRCDRPYTAEQLRVAKEVYDMARHPDNDFAGAPEHNDS